MNKITKTFTSVAMAVGIVSAVATSATAGEFDGVTLKVATWGGSWKENMEKVIVPKFEALGGKIEFVTGSPASSFAKLVAGLTTLHAASTDTVRLNVAVMGGSFLTVSLACGLCLVQHKAT